jgi:hypothetical protein
MVPTLSLYPCLLPGDDLAKILLILSVGMVASLVFTAQVRKRHSGTQGPNRRGRGLPNHKRGSTLLPRLGSPPPSLPLHSCQATLFIRSLVNTPTKPVGKGKASSPFLSLHYLAWAAVTVASGVAIVAAPSSAASFALPFTLSITIIGYLLGNAVPAKFQGLLHPVLSTALAGNFACALYGIMSSAGYESAMKIFLAKVGGEAGGRGSLHEGGVLVRAGERGGGLSSHSGPLRLLQRCLFASLTPLGPLSRPSALLLPREPGPWVLATCSCPSSAPSSSRWASASTTSATP